MSGFTDQIVFRLGLFIDKKSAFTAEDSIVAEGALLSSIDESPIGSLNVVDFEESRIASAAARTLLRRAIKRLLSGELEDRYIVLANLGESAYSVEVMLSGESLTSVARTDHGPQLMGRVDPAVKDTYEYLLSVSDATAGILRETLQLQNISTATNRLATLSKLGLARRVEQRPAAGGGREFVYVAVR
jgi:hypothetical protein